MNKTTKVAIVLMLCAIVLGVGGGLLLMSESNRESLSAVARPLREPSTTVWFECPMNDPNCHPPG